MRALRSLAYLEALRLSGSVRACGPCGFKVFIVYSPWGCWSSVNTHKARATEYGLRVWGLGFGSRVESFRGYFRVEHRTIPPP